MKNRTPARLAPDLDFEPVPRKHRHDGWTPDRQRAFIAALAETGSVSRAAARINMAKEGAYQLRLAPGSEGFRAAWAAALDHGVQQLADIALDRARDGVPVPVFHRGEQVGERRWFNDRLLMFVLKHHMPARYGGQIGGGTRSKATLEREAAENCPTCRERSEGQASERKDYAAFLDEVLRRYMLKVRYEHEKRRAGDWTAADFTLRQLTHLELILDLGGRSRELVRRFSSEPYGPGEAVELYAGPVSQVIHELREEYWASVDAPPRPPVPLPARPDGGHLHRGPTAETRHRARDDAEALMKRAQETWEAARTEESWAAWLAAKSV